MTGQDSMSPSRISFQSLSDGGTLSMETVSCKEGDRCCYCCSLRKWRYRFFWPRNAISFTGLVCEGAHGVAWFFCQIGCMWKQGRTGPLVGPNQVAADMREMEMVFDGDFTDLRLRRISLRNFGEIWSLLELPSIGDEGRTFISIREVKIRDVMIWEAQKFSCSKLPRESCCATLQLIQIRETRMRWQRRVKYS